MAAKYVHVVWLLGSIGFAVAFHEPPTPGGQHEKIEANGSASRFYCLADRKHIERVKLCNFLNDCSDGEDERNCGACNFTLAEEGGANAWPCGLRLEAGSLLQWKRANIIDWRSTEDCLHCHRKLEFVESAEAERVRYEYSRLETRRELADLTARILLPRLRPTDNEACKLIIRMEQPQIPKQVVLIEPVAANWSKSSEAPPYELSQLEGTFRWEEGGSAGGNFMEYSLGRREQDFWSLLIEVQTTMCFNRGSHRFVDKKIGPISFQSCEPREVAQLERAHKRPADSAEFDESLAAKCRRANRFLCKLSGKCIDRRFVCDFGRDCGPFDHSDEDDCAHFEARCDFERGHECGWITSDSWFLAQAKYNATDQFFSESPYDLECERAAGAHSPETEHSGPTLDQRRWPPLLDHTRQSDRWRAHFLQLNTSSLSESQQSVHLLGPLVQLKPGHRFCSFRFWMSTHLETKSVVVVNESAPLEGLRLRVGDQLAVAFRPREQHEQASVAHKNRWRGFELPILTPNSGAVQELKLTLEGPREALRNLSRADAFLALDDFSFSLGCQPLFQLANHQNASLCPRNQFRCAAPPADNPSGWCIPWNHVCDLKPDCAREPQTNRSSDEIGCASECRFDDNSATLEQCGLVVRGLNDELHQSAKPYEIDYSKEARRGLQIRWANWSGVMLSAPFYNDKLYEIQLPAFNQTHANCSLELDYSWSDGRRLTWLFVDSIGLEGYKYYGAERLVAQMEASDDSASGRHTLRLDIGERNRKFHIGIQLRPNWPSFQMPHREHEPKKVGSFGGSFTFLAYRFLNCAHRRTRLSLNEPPKEAEGASGQQIAAARSVNMSCPAGEFQCAGPLLCLAESLICDMQTDCQDNASDELDCRKRGVKQYDFGESHRANDKSNAFRDGWTPDESENGRWRLSELPFFELRYGVKPVDHTRRGLPFMLTMGSSERQASSPVRALIYSPRMALAPACKRVVFYFRHWTDDLDERTKKIERNPFQLKVYIVRTSKQLKRVESSLLYALQLDKIERQAKWVRVELALPPAGAQNKSALGRPDADEFRLALLGQLPSQLESGSSASYEDLLSSFALDDFSFGPHCELVESRQDIDLKLPAFLLGQRLSVNE